LRIVDNCSSATSGSHFGSRRAERTANPIGSFVYRTAEYSESEWTSMETGPSKCQCKAPVGGSAQDCVGDDCW
jgi:hypothetical protein